MVFDQRYFETIWPESGVHRHDYCPDLAERLVHDYGKVRFLDIGTGCGYLIKCLRELGAEAWGLELSEYAVQESHGFVRQGDVRNIPFAADSFDVVFSQGLWCHIPEADIQTAWQECQRVGKTQVHYIDYEEAPQDIPYFVTRKSESWWKNQFYPKVLVGCPNHEVKEYAFAEWIEAINNLDYPNYDVLVVDNSPTLDFYNRWNDKVPMVHIDTGDWATGENPNPRINMSMEVLRQKFIEGDYQQWFNVESDVIVPSHALNLLRFWGRDADWICHAYPGRGSDYPVQGIGCSLFSRRIMEAYTFANASEQSGPDAWFWEQVMNKFTTAQFYSMMPVKHLGIGQGSI